MKKLFIAIISVALLVSAMSITAMANDGSVPRYVTTQTYLYENSNANSRILETIPAGSKINAWVDVRENGFTNAMTANNSGWVATAFISTTPGGSSPTPTPAPTPAPAASDAGGGSLTSLDGTWNCYKTLCQRTEVYSSPTTAQNPMATMEGGTSVYVESVTNGFAHITSPYNGYIVSTYVDGWNVPTNYPKTSNTWYLGHDWSYVYNYDYYKANNPDVVAALGTGEQALLQHFVNNGMKEGRRGNGSFDLYNYVVNNKYLYDRFGFSDLSKYYKYACGIPV